MAEQRPINLNLFTIKFPIPAIISILHRVSGAFLFLLIPVLLWFLQASFTSINRFDDIQDFLLFPSVRFFIWIFFAALIFHLVAGIRHLMMDLGLGESLKAARFSSWAVLFISSLITLGLGIWLWQLTS